MKRLSNVDRKGRLHQASGRDEWTRRSLRYSQVNDASRNAWNNREFHVYTGSLRRGNSITSKVTSPLEYSMDFVLLSLMTQREAQCISWFISRLAADRTKDNSWPFRTGIPSIGFKNRRILIDMMTLYTATRQHVINLISCSYVSYNSM